MDRFNALPLLAMRGIVIFPHMVLHFDVMRKKSVKAVEDAMINDQYLFLVSQKDDMTENPSEDDLYKVGTVVKVKQVVKMPGDTITVLIDALYRAKICEITKTEPFFEAIVERVYTDDEDSLDANAMLRILKQRFEEYFAVNTHLAPEIMMSVMNEESANNVIDIVIANTNIPKKDKQAVLGTVDTIDRLELLINLLTKEIQITSVQRDIAEKVKKSVDKNQKDYYLREQIKVIQKELGDYESLDEEIADYKEKLENIKPPKEVYDKINKELSRLEKMPYGMQEGVIVRNYIDTLMELPWSKRTKERFDIEKARFILDRDHYGLEKVKERVLEYLAVRKLAKGGKSPILCLVGPPGVGKTSVAKSIAEALNRKYVRISLGGVKDEAEIRGHRRTYIGSMPGRIIAGMKQAGSKNPLMLFDEIDKIGNDMRGDPASAMLEVLDPEQNKTFKDHYLEVDFDLSEVLFLTTANTVDTIPRPLLDRMEVIELSAYTDEEKLEIALNHLLPKQLGLHGLTSKKVKIESDAVKDIITFYTREAGVRNLERELANLCRKIARDIIENKPRTVTITTDNLTKYLGKHRYSINPKNEKSEIGIARGLAWTSVGGETLSIEVNVMKGNGKVELTGKLGDVMKESAMAAISYIRSRASALGIAEDFHLSNDIHIHVPEGAVPKDGPSAGITMATALVSALSQRPVRNDVAMTGEITIRGRVLPIGGLKEKCLAAYKAGIRTIIIPMENSKDIEDIPSAVADKLSFVLVDSMDAVLDTALVSEKSSDKADKPFITDNVTHEGIQNQPGL